METTELAFLWWIIGRSDCPEFSLGPLVDQPCVEFPSVAAALATAADPTTTSSSPSGIVVWLPRPHHFAASEIETLAEIFPLTKLITVVGPWCEGELRTGSPAKGVLRSRWSDWRIMPLSEWLALPPITRTRSPIETFLAIEIDSPRQRPTHSFGQVAIVTPWLETFESLSEVVSRADFEPIWLRKSHCISELATCIAAVIDEDGLTVAPQDSAFPEFLGLVLRLVNAPRLDDSQTARSNETILAKPFELKRLEFWLQQVAASSQRKRVQVSKT